MKLIENIFRFGFLALSVPAIMFFVWLILDALSEGDLYGTFGAFIGFSGFIFSDLYLIKTIMNDIQKKSNPTH